VCVCEEKHRKPELCLHLEFSAFFFSFQNTYLHIIHLIEWFCINLCSLPVTFWVFYYTSLFYCVIFQDKFGSIWMDVASTYFNKNQYQRYEVCWIIIVCAYVIQWSYFFNLYWMAYMVENKPCYCGRYEIIFFIITYICDVFKTTL
jgi:hypothetical protein